MFVNTQWENGIIGFFHSFILGYFSFFNWISHSQNASFVCNNNPSLFRWLWNPLNQQNKKKQQKKSVFHSLHSSLIVFRQFSIQKKGNYIQPAKQKTREIHKWQTHSKKWKLFVFFTLTNENKIYSFFPPLKMIRVIFSDHFFYHDIYSFIQS